MTKEDQYMEILITTNVLHHWDILITYILNRNDGHKMVTSICSRDLWKNSHKWTSAPFIGCMTKWNSKPVTYTLFHHHFATWENRILTSFMQINDVHKKHNCFRIKISTFLLVYKKKTNNTPELSILTSRINTAKRTFYMECQWSSDLHSRDTQHRNNWRSLPTNQNSSLVVENNLKHLPNKIITAS